MSPYYVYFYKGGRDPSEHLVVVPQETFVRIWPHSNHLDMAWHHEVPADQLEGWEFPDVDEAHRVFFVDGSAKVRGAFGLCGNTLPWGLR